MKLVSACLLLLISAAGAAESLPSTPVFGDRLLSFRDGLPGDQVVAVGEDHLGYVWLGTTSGLARLAEPDIEVYGTAEGLPSRTVYRIAEDTDGRLWVGTLKGLAWFDGRRFRPDPEVTALQSRIRDLEVGPDGSLWALASSGGIWRRKAHHWSHVASQIPPGIVHMAVDRSGAIWLGGGPAGLVRFQPAASPGGEDRWERILTGNVLNLAADGPGVVVVCPDELRFFGTNDDARIAFNFGPISDIAVGCVSSPDGTVYVGTSNGLLRFDPRRRVFERLRSRRGAGESAALILRMTHDGNLWVGTVATGAALIFTGLPVAFMNTTAGGVTGTQFYALSFLSADEALVIEERGVYLARFRRDGSVTSSREICSSGLQGCPGSAASIIGTGAESWIIGGSDGIRRLRRVKEDDFRLENSPEFSPVGDQLVIDLARETDGTLWLATPRGPWKMRPGESPKLVPIDDPNPGVRSIEVSAKGRVWLITNGGRIWSLPPGQPGFSEIRPEEGRSTVENLFLADDHRIWITRSDRSCEAFDPETARKSEIVPAASVLAGLSPASLVNLGSGRYLAANHSGVSIIRLAPLSVESRLFSPSDLGDPDLEMSSSSLDPFRAVWLTSLGSLVRFDFENFHPPAAAPLSVEGVFDVRSGDRRLQPGADGSYSVPPRPNSTEVVLACPDHVGPHEVRFRSRLVGEDPDWGEWSSDRRIRLVNLAAGSYRFEAQALDRFGRINPMLATIAVEVRARFRETWMFRISLAALLMLAIIGAVRWRISRLIARKEELETIVEDRTRELAHANALLSESSLTDPLTGLRNRRYLAEVFARDIANQTRESRRRQEAVELIEAPFYFLLIDLDHFKKINDRVGHAAGDAVLKQFATILGEETRKGDISVRWGGEEFLVVSRQNSVEGERVLAERIRSAVARHPFVVGSAAGDPLHVTCSAGFVAYPVAGISENRLLWSDAIALADHALYHAKQHGRNRWVEIVVHGELLDASGPHADLVDVLLRDPAQAVRRGWFEMKSSEI